jgi:hypothetical protein
MNERINGLWWKARIGYNNQNCDPEVLEKFAELIVQECASLAKSKSEYIQSMETDDRGDQMQIQSLAWQFEEFGYKIKKHFGVKE